MRSRWFVARGERNQRTWGRGFGALVCGFSGRKRVAIPQVMRVLERVISTATSQWRRALMKCEIGPVEEKTTARGRKAAAPKKTPRLMRIRAMIMLRFMADVEICGRLGN